MYRSLIAAAITLTITPVRAQPPDAAYVLTLQPEPLAVAVTITTRGADSGTTELTVNEDWGGVRGHGKEITEISAVTEAGKGLTVERASDHSWRVIHGPGEGLSVTYILREPPDREPAQNHNDYRTMVRPGLFQMIGNLGLLHPSHLDGERARSYTVAWRGFDEEGWRTISSFGAGPGPTAVSLPPDRFRHSMFMAGEIRVLERTLRNTRVAFAIHGREWSFDDQRLADLTMRVITSERAFFDDFSDPYFLVTLVATARGGPGSFSLGGTGLTNCFALFCDPGMSLEKGSPHEAQVKRLLAHEYFHTWNGGKIWTDAPEGTAYWFSEGFTDFYARRLLLRAGLFTPEEFAEDLNSALTKYDTSPVKGAGNERIAAEFWKNRDIADLPYRRGDVVAVAVDEKIREVSGGARSLDDLMRDLLGRARSGEPAPTADVILTMIEERTTADFGALVRKCIVDGADMPLPERLTEPPLVLGSGKIRSYDPGFDFEASKAAGKIVGVRDGGEAYRAGLRDGMALRGYSIFPGSKDKPPHAEITVDENGAARTIAYDPLGGPTVVRRFAPAGAQPSH